MVVFDGTLVNIYDKRIIEETYYEAILICVIHLLIFLLDPKFNSTGTGTYSDTVIDLINGLPPLRIQLSRSQHQHPHTHYATR